MKKLGLLICFCGWAFSLWGQKVEKYEYWLDANDTERIEGTVSSDQTVRLSLDVSALNEGVHLLTFRAMDDRGQWSSPLTSFFYHYTNAENEIVSYEYWFDTDYTGKQEGTCGEQLSVALDVSGLSEGMHVLHIRFQDKGGKWSSPVDHNFYCTSNPTGIEMIDDKIDDVLSFTVPEGAQSGNVRLYGLNGRLIKAVALSDLSGGVKDLRPYCQGLSSGCYILRIEVLAESGTFTANKKFSIQ